MGGEGGAARLGGATRRRRHAHHPPFRPAPARQRTSGIGRRLTNRGGPAGEAPSFERGGSRESGAARPLPAPWERRGAAGGRARPRGEGRAGAPGSGGSFYLAAGPLAGGLRPPPPPSVRSRAGPRCASCAGRCPPRSSGGAGRPPPPLPSPMAGVLVAGTRCRRARPPRLPPGPVPVGLPVPCVLPGGLAGAEASGAALGSRAAGASGLAAPHGAAVRLVR